MEAKYLLQQRTVGYRIFSIFNTGFMLVLCIVFLYPILNVIANSLSSGPRLIAGQIQIIPQQIDLTAYRMVFHNRAIGRGYVNSIIYAGLGTACNLFLVSMVAYALSKRRLVFRGAISFYIAFTMLFSGGLIPTYLLVRSVGLYDSRAWIIGAHFFQVFHIVLMRTFYSSIPSSLEDSAKVDGYNDMQIMMKIFMPLSKPMLATLALFSIVMYWNDYFTSLIYLNDYAKYPLQMIIRDFLIPAEGSAYAGNNIFANEVNTLAVDGMDPIRLLQLSINLQNASIVVSAAPLVIVMTSVQRYFRRGIMVGALKD